MKKDSTVNTFQDGLIMDLNPLLTPNSALTNCLNGTIVTFNGNENVLQNDMGNGRVETAYLPQGYVPLGTAELGGIIYIVSYNPLINKCQIGCFPSPERNITSDEIKQGSNCSVNNLNFRDKNNDITTTEYKVELLPNNMKLNPGDQYSIYSTNKGITNNFHTLSFIGNTKHNMNNTDSQIYKNVEIHVISISDDGKITYLDDSLKWFENTFIEETYKPGESEPNEEKYNADYYIREVDGANDETINTDIGNYRSLVSSAYNIFNSKTSGKLALLFKLNVIDTFSATWECHNIRDKEITDGSEKSTTREVKIDFNINYTSQHSTINPNCIISNITKSGDIKCEDKDGNEIQLSEVNWMNIDIPENRKNDGTDSNISVPLSKYTKDENNKVTSTRLTFVCEDFDESKNYQLVCKLTPSMSFGNLPYLSQTLTINLEKINSGEIEINDWRYYVTSKEAIINFNLDAYPKAKQKIEEIKLQFLPPQYIYALKPSEGDNYETDDEKINGITYYEDCDKIIQVGKIQSGQYQTKLKLGDIYPKNCLFLVDIVLKISEKGKYSYYHYSKFLYTCGIFNDKYYLGEKFDDLCIDNYLKPTMECVLSNKVLNQTSSIPSDIDGILGYVSKDTDYANGTMCAQTTNISDTSDIECNIVDKNYPDLFIYESEITEDVKVKDIRYINNKPTSDTSDDESGREAVKSIPDINSTSINKKLNGIIKTSIDNDEYKDCFIPKIENKKLNIKGVIYSRINALVENKTVTSQNCLRPVLYTIYDLDSLGLKQYDDGNINFKYSFVMESGDHGGGEDFKLTMKKYLINSETFPNEFAGASQNFYMMDEVETGKKDFGGDGSFTKNWNQVNKFKNQAVLWMEEIGNLFAFWQFNYKDKHKHQRKWKDGTGCRNKFETYSSNRQYANLFMIRGHNDMFYPMNYFMGYKPKAYTEEGIMAGRMGSNELCKVIMALLTQLYYVQKDLGTSMTLARVTNINYINDYNVELELEFSKQTSSIYVKIKPYTYTNPDTNITETIEKYKLDNQQSKYQNIYVENDKKNVTCSYTKNYFINNDELYEKYNSNKNLICPCIAKTGYGDFPVNIDKGGILYTPKCFEGVSATKFTPSFNKNGTLYINTELQINEETGVITMKFPCNENTKRITDGLMSSLRIDSDYKLYAEDSKILKNGSDMRCAEYSAQSTDFNIKFKGNSSVEVYLGQNT